MIDQPNKNFLSSFLAQRPMREGSDDWSGPQSFVAYLKKMLFPFSESELLSRPCDHGQLDL